MGKPTPLIRLRAVADLVKVGWTETDACELLRVRREAWRAHKHAQRAAEEEAKKECGVVPVVKLPTLSAAKSATRCKGCRQVPYMGVCGCIEPAHTVIDNDGRVL